MKYVIIGLAVILIILSCGLAIRYNQEAKKAREELNSERYKRLVFEENLQEVNRQVGTLSTELEKAQGKIENTTLVLEKTKAINAELKQRLDKASEIQASLDKRILELQQMAQPL